MSSSADAKTRASAARTGGCAIRTRAANSPISLDY
jgi:hypothetical protein